MRSRLMKATRSYSSRPSGSPVGLSRSYFPPTPWKKFTRCAQRRRGAGAHGSALTYTSNRRHSASRWVRTGAAGTRCFTRSGCSLVNHTCTFGCRARASAIGASTAWYTGVRNSTSTSRRGDKRPSAWSSRCAIGVSRRSSVTEEVPSGSPALPDDAGEKPEPEFVIERGDRIAADERGDPGAGVSNRRSIEIPGHAEDMWHAPGVRRRLLGRFHVETRSFVQQRAADAAPVEPAAEVTLPQPGCWNHVPDRDLGHVASVHAGRPRANAPLADFLPEQRPRLAADIRIEQP